MASMGKVFEALIYCFVYLGVENAAASLTDVTYMSPIQVLNNLMGGGLVSVYVNTPQCQVISVNAQLPPWGSRPDITFIQYMGPQMWYLGFASEDTINGRDYNLTTTARRLRQTHLKDNGTVTIDVDIIDPLNGTSLVAQSIKCEAGNDSTAGIQFVQRLPSEVPLNTTDDVLKALFAGKQLIFSVDLHWCPPYLPELVHPIWAGKITEYRFDKNNDFVFSKSFPDLQYINMLTFKLTSMGNVTVTTSAMSRTTKKGTPPFEKHCQLGQVNTFFIYQH